MQHARDHDLELLCVNPTLVNPMLVARGREGEDYTRERADYRDGAIIARLTSERRCFRPYQPQGPWARLRHVGIHRYQQLERASATRQGLRDLLSCYWPSAFSDADDPMRSLTFRATLCVSADPEHLTNLEHHQLARHANQALTAWGGRRLHHAILQRLHASAHHPGGVRAERSAAGERATLTARAHFDASSRKHDAEARMVGILHELGIAPITRTLPGLSLLGAATILAETGDPNRFTHPRAWVKHAGLCPRANESGNHHGQTRTSGRGRPRLLRQLFVMITTHSAWNPAIAAGQDHLLDAA